MYRIGIDTRDLLIAKTGTRTYLESICLTLPQVSEDDEFIFLQPKQIPPQGHSPLNKIINHFLYYWWKEIQLPWLTWRNRCDLLFCTDYVVPLISSCPAVPVFHGSNFWERPKEYNKIWLTLMNFFGLRAARKSPAIITVSQFSKGRISDVTGIPLSKIVAIHLAPKKMVLNHQSKEETRKILTKFGIGANTPFILHVGVLEKRKNLPRLIRAFSLSLPGIGDQYRLVLVGQPGPKKDMDDSVNIQNEIRECQVSERVILPGHVSDEELAAFYQGAYLYALPSLYEGFGLPALEAFANNLPLIASTAAAIPEVVGNAGILFDPYEVEDIKRAMIQGVLDEEQREQMIALGKERVAGFSWDRTAREILNLFHKIISQKKSENSARSASYEE